MERRKIVRFVVGAAAIMLLPALAGCTGWTSADRTAAPRLTAHKDTTGLRWTHVAYTAVAAPRQTAYNDDTGFRWTHVDHSTALRPIAYNEYYYYQDVKVYYHVHTGYYYYFYNDGWWRTKQRPDFLYLDENRRQSIVIRSEQPYARHAHHLRKYPAQPIPPGHARNLAPPPNQLHNNGVGNGVVKPGNQPQPQPHLQPVHQAKPQSQPVHPAKPQPQPVQQAKPQPVPVQPAKPQPVPQSAGQGKSKAVQPCNTGGKGKGTGACG